MGSCLPPPMARSSTAPGAWETGRELFCGHAELFSGTFPRWGTLRNGVLYRRQPPEPPTAGTGCSSGLLPTPNAQLAHDSQTHRSGARTDELLLTGIALQMGKAALLPTPRASPGENRATRRTPSQRQDRHGLYLSAEACELALLPTPQAFDGMMEPKTQEQIKAHRDQGRGGDRNLREYVLHELDSEPGTVSRWGRYAPAIERWEAILGRPAPDPTQPNGKGEPRLNPALPEWMMGFPEGWVTDVPGISRKDQLKILGNSCQPQQAAMALRILLERMGST
jgi:DNA (cytosine-5)-methyltransferase 1